jgi:deoxyxylulose-5-phosphate synthase
VLELYAAHDKRVLVHTLGVPDRFFEQASQSRLREMAGLSPQQIAAAATGLLVTGAKSMAAITTA